MNSQSFNYHKCPLIIWDSLKETKVNSPFYDMEFNHACKCCSYSYENILKMKAGKDIIIFSSVTSRIYYEA